MYCSAEGKPLSKNALKKQRKDAEKAKRRADTAAKVVCSLWLPCCMHYSIKQYLCGIKFSCIKAGVKRRNFLHARELNLVVW